MDHGVNPHLKVQVFLIKLIGILNVSSGTRFRVPLFVFLRYNDFDLLELLLGGILLRLLFAYRFFVFGAAYTNLEVTLVKGGSPELLIRDR